MIITTVSFKDNEGKDAVLYLPGMSMHRAVQAVEDEWLRLYASVNKRPAQMSEAEVEEMLNNQEIIGEENGC